ncbi:MAG: hypothetical protein WCV71_02115 [Patescibacteria group bacterium]
MNLNLSWFEVQSYTEQDFFIRHLKLGCHRQYFLPSKRRLILDVCIPILQAIREGKGITQESWDLVRLAESRQFRRSEIEPTIWDIYQEFSSPMNSLKAARYLGLSQRHCLRIIAGLARLNDNVHKSKKKGWQVPVVALDDWLIKYRPATN